MQINGYSNAINPYHSRTQNTVKNHEAFGLQADKNTAIAAATETKQLTETEEMDAFKKEIHAKISEIYRGTSSIILSNSVHITEGAFEKMKADPEFKNKMMNILREDAHSALLLPYQTTTTTTIDENGYSAYGLNIYPHDSAESKAKKIAGADQKAEGAFYHTSSCESESSQKKTDFDKIWLQNKEKQDLLKRTQRNRSFLRQMQSKEALIDDTYLSGYAQGFERKNSERR